MFSTDLSFQFKRHQYSIKVMFAVTIIKTQGQIFQYVGIDLRSVSHMDSYVGLSRTGKLKNQFIKLPDGLKTKNFIYSKFH